MHSKPNVVFIISDQHNAKVLGHKNHPDVKTPNLDRLANEGVRLENEITQNPICTPSRVSLLSGQYCHNHGFYGLSGPRPQGLPTVLGHFRRHGYATAALGKIHCPEYWVEDDSDLFRETGNCSIGGNPEYMAHIQEQGLTEEHNLSESRKGPYGQCMDGYKSPLPYRHTPEGWTVDQAVQFMSDSTNSGTPFFLHISFPRPHQTYAPAEYFWELYDENRLTMPPNWHYEMKDKAPHLRRSVQGFIDNAEDWTVVEPHTYEAGCRRKLRGYLGNISMVDHATGELLDYLDKAGLAEDTIVIYTSDHGDYACEHGIVEKAPGICADAITRVPSLWRWPGRFKAGHAVEALTEHVDLAPTLCGLTNLAPLSTSDGKDISKLLAGDNQPLREIGVTEFAWSKSVRKGDFRLVYYPKDMFKDEYPDGFGELYDLRSDPWEMNNLYFNPEYRETALSLERDLMDWLVTTTRVVNSNCSKQPTGPQSLERFGCRTNLDGKISPDDLRGIDNVNYL